MVWLLDGAKKFNRLKKQNVGVWQTDRGTDIMPQDSPRYAYASRAKTIHTHLNSPYGVIFGLLCQTRSMQFIYCSFISMTSVALIFFHGLILMLCKTCNVQRNTATWCVTWRVHVSKCCDEDKDDVNVRCRYCCVWCVRFSSRNSSSPTPIQTKRLLRRTRRTMQTWTSRTMPMTMSVIRQTITLPMRCVTCLGLVIASTTRPPSSSAATR